VHDETGSERDGTAVEARVAAAAGADGAVGRVAGQVERFPGAGGWYVVRLGAARSAEVAGLARRGSVPVRVTVGSTSWDSSLMAVGDGTLFLALPAAVRLAEDLDEGDAVSARYRVRPGGRRQRAAPARRRDRW
jgi:hypothetical protein